VIHKYFILIWFLISNIYAESFLVVNGNSYHYNTNNYDYCGDDCNENNWGVGFENHTNDLVYSLGSFIDSWYGFSWYSGVGREYKLNRFIRTGFSLGVMNKNYAREKQLISLYWFPLVILNLTNSVAINITIIPSSNLFGDLTGGTEWPTTLFFQYKFKINTGGGV